MKFYDCHVHTEHSFDSKAAFGSKASVDAMCTRAIESGYSCLTVTDHNYPAPEGMRAPEHIRASVEEVNRKKEQYKGKIELLSGVELGDPLDDAIDLESYYAIPDIDCIVGSLHSTLLFKTYFPDNPYGTDFRAAGKSADETFLKQAVCKYFEMVSEVAEKVDADILAHITFPFRYINGLHKRGLSVSEFSEWTDNVLRSVISSGKVLEINTSGFQSGFGFMPEESLLKRYYELGGRKISLGSDAHSPEQLGRGFPEAIALLKNIGFTHGSYFVKRKRQEYLL